MPQFYHLNGIVASHTRQVSNETGKTSYIERFNNILRQRVSRLVRKTLSFSKSLENHIVDYHYSDAGIQQTLSF